MELVRTRVRLQRESNGSAVNENVAEGQRRLTCERSQHQRMASKEGADVKRYEFTREEIMTILG